MELIQAISLQSSSSTIAFAGIPNTFQKLYLFASLRNDSSASSSPALMVAMSSTSNYNTSYRETGSSNVNSGNYNNKVNWQDMYGGVISDVKSSNSFGAFYMSVNNYADTTETTMIAQGTSNSSESTNTVGVYGGIINDQSAQNAITLSVSNGNFKTGCLVALYGA